MTPTVPAPDVTRDPYVLLTACLTFHKLPPELRKAIKECVDARVAPEVTAYGEELPQCVLDLLAVLNGDGGHFRAEHGLEAACKRAQKRYYAKEVTAEPHVDLIAAASEYADKYDDERHIAADLMNAFYAGDAYQWALNKRAAPEVTAEPIANTDRELWRERDGDYYADSIHVTEQGGIGINCGGRVFVMTLRHWHDLASGAIIPAPKEVTTWPSNEIAEGVTGALEELIEWRSGKRRLPEVAAEPVAADERERFAEWYWSHLSQFADQHDAAWEAWQTALAAPTIGAIIEREVNAACDSLYPKEDSAP